MAELIKGLILPFDKTNYILWPASVKADCKCIVHCKESPTALQIKVNGKQRSTFTNAKSSISSSRRRRIFTPVFLVFDKNGK